MTKTQERINQLKKLDTENMYAEDIAKAAGISVEHAYYLLYMHRIKYKPGKRWGAVVQTSKSKIARRKKTDDKIKRLLAMDTKDMTALEVSDVLLIAESSAKILMREHNKEYNR